MKLSELKIKLFSCDLTQSIQLNECTYISNVKNTVESLILVLESNPKNMAYLPYYNTLMKIYKKLHENELR